MDKKKNKLSFCSNRPHTLTSPSEKTALITSMLIQSSKNQKHHVFGEVGKLRITIGIILNKNWPSQYWISWTHCRNVVQNYFIQQFWNTVGKRMEVISKIRKEELQGRRLKRGWINEHPPHGALREQNGNRSKHIYPC